MGIRFRKSFNLGGGFRVNVSKSGIGYSWGTKGFRYTKTARGVEAKDVLHTWHRVLVCFGKRKETLEQIGPRPRLEHGEPIPTHLPEPAGAHGERYQHRERERGRLSAG